MMQRCMHRHRHFCATLVRASCILMSHAAYVYRGTSQSDIDIDFNIDIDKHTHTHMQETTWNINFAFAFIHI